VKALIAQAVAKATDPKRFYDQDPTSNLLLGFLDAMSREGTAVSIHLSYDSEGASLHINGEDFFAKRSALQKERWNLQNFARVWNTHTGSSSKLPKIDTLNVSKGALKKMGFTATGIALAAGFKTGEVIPEDISDIFTVSTVAVEARPGRPKNDSGGAGAPLSEIAESDEDESADYNDPPDTDEDVPDSLEGGGISA